MLNDWHAPWSLTWRHERRAPDAVDCVKDDAPAVELKGLFNRQARLLRDAPGAIVVDDARVAPGVSFAVGHSRASRGLVVQPCGARQGRRRPRVVSRLTLQRREAKPAARLEAGSASAYLRPVAGWWVGEVGGRVQVRLCVGTKCVVCSESAIAGATTLLSPRVGSPRSRAVVRPASG